MGKLLIGVETMPKHHPNSEEVLFRLDAGLAELEMNIKSLRDEVKSLRESDLFNRRKGPDAGTETSAH